MARRGVSRSPKSANATAAMVCWGLFLLVLIVLLGVND